MTRWRWQLEVFAVRHGLWWAPGLALLLLAAAAWLVWLPAQEAALLQAQEAVARQRARPAARQVADAAAAPQLPSSTTADEGVQRLFALAQDAGLKIAQADYRRQSSSPVGRWQVQVPATGTYPQVRYFVRAARQAVPGLSLDEISLQKGQEQGAVEARMLFSIWYDASKGEAP
jgi:Tfp pilus assembly protein PilO